MYELIKVGEQSYYIESPARIGVYVENGHIWLIVVTTRMPEGKLSRF